MGPFRFGGRVLFLFVHPEGIGHESFSPEKSRDPASVRRSAAFDPTSSASRRDRTFDLVLKRDLLYQLSYGCLRGCIIPQKRGRINYDKMSFIGVMAKW
jgi:hypothetical protein